MVRRSVEFRPGVIAVASALAPTGGSGTACASGAMARKRETIVSRAVRVPCFGMRFLLPAAVAAGREWSRRSRPIARAMRIQSKGKVAAERPLPMAII